MNRWQPRLIATDIDGTLLNSHAHITAVTRRAIAQARQAGMRVVVCSGRHFSGARAIAYLAGMGDLVIAGNGAEVRTFEGVTIFQKLMQPGQCHAVWKIAQRHGLTCNLYACDTVFASAPNRVVSYYRRLNRRLPSAYRCRCILVHDLSRMIDRHADGLLKMEVLAPTPDAIDEFRAFGKNVPVVFEGNWRTSIEVHAAGTHKGTGLEIAAAYYGLPLDSTLAFGDAENDVPLLQTAFTGAAVANASPAAQMAADIIVPDNDHHGVARTIIKYSRGDPHDQSGSAGQAERETHRLLSSPGR